MGVIIHYDFRKKERQREMEEIQDRVSQRLMEYIQNPNYYADEKISDEIHKDNLRYIELEKEEIEWGGKDKWVELY